MPQMAPLSWITLYFMFIMIFLLFNCWNYYMFYYNNKSLILNKKSFKIFWKW